MSEPYLQALCALLQGTAAAHLANPDSLRRYFYRHRTEPLLADAVSAMGGWSTQQEMAAVQRAELLRCLCSLLGAAQTAHIVSRHTSG